MLAYATASCAPVRTFLPPTMMFLLPAMRLLLPSLTPPRRRFLSIEIYSRITHLHASMREWEREFARETMICRERETNFAMREREKDCDEREKEIENLPNLLRPKFWNFLISGPEIILFFVAKVAIKLMFYECGYFFGYKYIFAQKLNTIIIKIS